MGNVGPFELLLVVLVILLLFGSAKLPKLARSIGEASKEFKKGVNEAATDGDAGAVKPPEPTPPKPDDSVTMTRAELEALLAERDARARRETPPPA